MGYNYPGTKIKIKSYMIIKRKSFTRQETKAMKEMYQALKKGNIGRGLSAKKFVKARHVSNETIDALISQETAPITNYTKNSQIINDIGLPETAKAYKRMMEKYTNPTLRKRFERVQAASSNNKLRVARQNVKILVNLLLILSHVLLQLENKLEIQKYLEVLIYLSGKKINQVII